MKLRRQLTVAPALVLLMSSASAGPDPGVPRWLSGQWCSGDGERRIEEHWLPHQGDMLLGVNRTLEGGRTVSFEYLRIARVDGQTTYIAQPGGRPPTSFRRVDGGADWVRFENPAHDFPQRIEYRREGARLRAEIAGPGAEDGETVVVFEFIPCPL